MAGRKILHLSQSTGGVKTYVAHVIEYADPTLFEFTVMAPANEDFESFCEQRKVRYFKVNLERGLNPFKLIFSLYQIVKVVRTIRPDLIHAHSAMGGFLGRVAAAITGKPIIYTPHAFSYKPFKGLKRAFFLGIEAAVKNLTTHVLAISYTEASNAIAEVGFHSEKVSIVLNAIPCEQTQRIDALRIVKNIRMIGRLTHQKNPMLFLQIAAMLLKQFPHLHFSILGAGIHDHLMSEITEFIQTHKLNESISILSWGGVDLTEEFLKDTDIYISTSVFEGLPFSLLEAMLMGIPCVVSNVEGNADVIQNGDNGLVCSDVISFCYNIESLILDSDKRIRIAENAYRHVIEKHNIKKSIIQLQHIYFKYAYPTVRLS